MTITASIIGPTFVTVMLSGVTHTITNDHANYDAIRVALKNKEHDKVEALINVKASFVKYVQGKVNVVGDQVFYGDMEVRGAVVTRILSMIREGFDANPVLLFLENLMANPSKRAVDELYGFLEATALPITEDGHFLAYKKVRDDYKDFYTGKMDNSVGAAPSMPRNQVNEDKDQTCSQGLHFCSRSYLSQYHGGQGRVMILKINPANVVSIPSDYNNSKGRAWTYEIIGEHKGHEQVEAFTASVYNGMSPSTPTGWDWTDSGSNSYDAEQEHNDGYSDGDDQATNDSSNLAKYNCVPDPTRSTDYQLGYADGYSDNYYVDWNDVGYNAAARHVGGNWGYNDTPPDACDDDNEYKEGYANGWRDEKIARL